MNSTTVAATAAATASAAVRVTQGFSLTNRLLLYASMLLARAQFISGVGSNCPSNLGFLAFNLYTQVIWCQAAKAHQFHALSLLVTHFVTIYAISYIGGITSGNKPMRLILTAGTCGVLALNLATSWIAWKTNLPEGFEQYQFFFFGWRTLNHKWYWFFLVWEIANTIIIIGTMFHILTIAANSEALEDEVDETVRLLAIPVGIAETLLASWPLILWTELIVARNHIASDTDWVSVGLFIAQVVLMLISLCTGG